MKYGLSEKSLGELNAILASMPHIEEAVIYGSRARGDYWRASDVDLSLKGEQLTRSDLLELDGKLYESCIPFFFDLCIYNQLADGEFKASIDREGVTIYKKTE